jgi:hypothetical protein
MAVWDLNSNLDVFADGGHFEPRSGSLNTILKVDHLRTIDDMFAILAYLFQRRRFENIFSHRVLV